MRARLILPTLTLTVLASAAGALEPGWSYSPLPGEGDRASMGCDRAASEEHHTCLVVRCEDDFSVGLHLQASRAGGVAGRWEMTVDRENHSFETLGDPSPYSARIGDPEGWLLERLRQGTFVYLRHADDAEAPFAYIGLSGSYDAIHEALRWCAPRLPQGEQKSAPDVDPNTL